MSAFRRVETEEDLAAWLELRNEVLDIQPLTWDEFVERRQARPPESEPEEWISLGHAGSEP